MAELTERQIAFLRVLRAARINRSVNYPWASGTLYPGRVFHEAYPDAEHAGRRDAGATRTLDALQRLGFVDGRYSSVHATGREWSITDAGELKLDEIDGIVGSRMPEPFSRENEPSP